MPEIERPAYRRFEVFFPLDLWGAVERAAGRRNVTAWLCALAAERVGVAYEPKPVGRPVKTAKKPPPKKKPARKKK
jgi:hypothetical protein